MATGQHKIRIYDLAKELKLDNKKVMEDARREGIDVSVPSNTVPHEVAERIRQKYFPKKTAPHVGPRLVKHARKPEPHKTKVRVLKSPPPSPSAQAAAEAEPKAAAPERAAAQSTGAPPAQRPS